MKTKSFTIILTTAFVLMAVFGLFMPTMSHGGHEGCPFAPVSTGNCVALFEHVGHWQSSFTAALVQLSTLISTALVFFLLLEVASLKNPEFERHRLRRCIPLRPFVLQELYSQGILNRKEPQS